MTRHLSVRLAWHDNNWNGQICSDPAANIYCTGTHSLLSERIARDKETEREASSPNAALDRWMPDYVPPCFWSSNAFSKNSAAVVHAHPFQTLKDRLRIEDRVPAYAVYTWPFRLSFNHAEARKKRDGSYPPNLTSKIAHFQKRFKPSQSLVFFYLNYDNPISADEHAFALVGCSLLADITTVGDFPFERRELAEQRRRPNMQHFPTMNWALKVEHDFQSTGVMLPYGEYARLAASDPAVETKLEEMRVLIDEPAIRPSFKYVAEELDDDACLVLLYKLRKAFERVTSHAIADPGDAIERIDALLRLVWSSRGLFPGLDACADFLTDLGELGAITESERPAQTIGRSALEAYSSAQAAFEAAWTAIQNGVPNWNASQEVTSLLARAKVGASTYAELLPALRRLSLLNIAKAQIERLLLTEGADFPPEAIAANPYLCCEDAAEVELTPEDLDQLERRKPNLAFHNVDLGLFPDARFLSDRTELHNLAPASPFRLRAFSVASLRRRAEQGDAYVSEEDILDDLRHSPIIQQDELRVSAAQLKNPQAREHFKQRLHLADNESGTYHENLNRS